MLVVRKRKASLGCFRVLPCYSSPLSSALFLRFPTWSEHVDGCLHVSSWASRCRSPPVGVPVSRQVEQVSKLFPIAIVWYRRIIYLWELNHCDRIGRIDYHDNKNGHFKSICDHGHVDCQLITTFHDHLAGHDFCAVTINARHWDHEMYRATATREDIIWMGRLVFLGKITSFFVFLGSTQVNTMPQGRI